MLSSVVVGPLFGFVATGVPRAVVSENRCCMLLESSAFFLLSKLDLSQVRFEREVLEKEISELDARIVVGQQETVAALPATAPGGGLDVVAALLHPISPLLPIPALAVPMAALYYARARPRSPAQATAGSAALYYPSGLLERGGAAARVRAAPPQTLTLTHAQHLTLAPTPTLAQTLTLTLTLTLTWTLTRTLALPDRRVQPRQPTSSRDGLLARWNPNLNLHRDSNPHPTRLQQPIWSSGAGSDGARPWRKPREGA